MNFLFIKMVFFNFVHIKMIFVKIIFLHVYTKNKTRKNAIVEYLDYQIPVTQLMGPKGNGDMHAAKRDSNAPPTRDLNIWLCGR